MKKQCDLAYSETESDIRRIDVFLPGSGGNGACIFFVHGGGWRGGSRQSWHSVMAHFCSLGYVCTSTSYHLLPDYHFPLPFEDVRLAMSWVKERAEEFGFDSDRISVWGSSAGGHLAALLATVKPDEDVGVTPEQKIRDTRPRAAVCLCTIFSVHEEGGFYRPDFLGGSEEDNPEIYRAASSIDHVSGGEPPFLMIVGDADETTPVTWHEAMHNKLVACGGSPELVVLPGVKHGFGYGIGTDAQQQMLKLTEQFLQRKLL